MSLHSPIARNLPWFLGLFVLVLTASSCRADNASRKSSTTEQTDTADGQLMDVNRLPKHLIEALKVQYPKGEITAAYKQRDGRPQLYLVKVKQGGQTIDVAADRNGNLLTATTLATKEMAVLIPAIISAKLANAQLLSVTDFLQYNAFQGSVSLHMRNGSYRVEATINPMSCAGLTSGIEVEIDPKTLPAPVIKSAAAAHPNSPIKEAWQDRDPFWALQCYRVVFDDPKAFFNDADIDTDGHILRPSNQ
jgi:hypothetical protein